MEKKYPWEKKWTARTKEVAKFIPIYATVLDIGGGLCELYDHLECPLIYNSLDIEEWTNHTIKADLNKEFPKVGTYQYCVVAGVLEYIDNPPIFLQKVSEHSNIMILTYRNNTKGGMPRKNNLMPEHLESIISVYWEILVRKDLPTTDTLYFCRKK